MSAASSTSIDGYHFYLNALFRTVCGASAFIEVRDSTYTYLVASAAATVRSYVAAMVVKGLTEFPSDWTVEMKAYAISVRINKHLKSYREIRTTVYPNYSSRPMTPSVKGY